MQQILGWLQAIGMSQYAECFAENGIDMAALPHLTDEDLKDIGVLLGHRRKILAEIEKFSGTSLVESHPTSVEQRAQTTTPERRQLTVMFCDLVGSTTLSARLDPEDLREVISAYQICVTETVRRFNGFVARYLGDGVLAYFGYPHAQEDDAERAVRAGLELIAAVGELKTHASLQTRVGIATGLVVVGSLIGSGDAHEIVGETPNLAARLQAIADANTVVIAESTRRLVGTLFELKELGGRELKGISGSTQVWAALSVSPIGSRFEALHGGALTPFIGRQQELASLLEHWSLAKASAGQVVLLSGEAGIGKSRLTVALMGRLALEPHIRLRYFCSPQRADSPFYPVIGQMERAAALTRGDTLKAKLDKLDTLLVRTSTPVEDAALFAEMLSLPNDGRYPAVDLLPQQRRQRTMEALIFQIRALTRSGPVLMIFEDAHWADPTSLETLGKVIDQIAALGMLLIVTFRPEFEPPWIKQHHITTIALNRLPQQEVGVMIDRVAGSGLLPVGIRQDIIERTDGIPLFIEETTKAVLEARSQEAAEHTLALVPSPAVPATLHASLMARLDRLGPAKEVAQIGAAIGREFLHALLAPVAGKPAAELASALNDLIVAGLLFRQGTPPDATYLFNHALVQDVAYGTLLRERRRALHARIAETIETQFPEIAENQPELVARHLTEAGLTEKAASLWGKAGQRSLERSALSEAIEQLTRALRQIATLPATPALRREQIKLQVAIITPLMHVKGYAAPEAKAAVERASQLIEEAQAMGEPPDDPLMLFSVLYASWAANYVAFNGDLIRDLATQFLALAEKQGDTAPLVIGHRLMGASLVHTGEIATGLVHYNRALAYFDPAEHRKLATRFGQDDRVSVLCYRSLGLWTLGYPEAALADIKNALGDARAMGQAATLMFALLIGSFTHILCGNYAAAEERTEKIVALAAEKSAFLWKAFGVSLQGCLLALTDKPADAVNRITAGIAAFRSTGATCFLPLYLAFLARANAALGNSDDAQRSIQEALQAIAKSKERWCEAEVYRTAGEIALMPPASEQRKAEQYFDRALAVARAQQAKSWELRAAISLARLWRERGSPEQGRELLAPIYDWFTEGFETVDLQEAKNLLNNLAS